ncbi:IS1182 family transposase [Streptomyces sp. NPDC004232]|uniref:IS1182 family transposase n=1 Tax=Streptomyces sp. NPDC004232 TaxID=3154454 RepID=UPI001D276CF6|nr:IS1182 family transposase [Streptomyces sp. tea 10]
MSMKPLVPGEVPAETVRVARAAFPKGSLAIRVRDELGVLFTDEQFSGMFPVRGKRAWSPGRLALVVVLQFVENLTDRQAAEAVRARIDWKYALGLELADPGFDYSVLCEFRDRLIGAEGGREVLDGVLAAARERGLLAGGGRARTDSTHVLSAVRELNQLELVSECLRSALNAVARLEPDWLRARALPDWFRHYATRADETRFPKDRTKRTQLYERIGADGMHLLRLVWAADAPPGLRELPEAEILRRAWVQHFHLVEGEVRRRGPKDRPPGATRLASPYDVQARNGVKGEIRWDGYKVHLTETCEPDTAHLITHVVTTNGAVSDDHMAATVHAGLAARDLLPAEHWVDAGYANAAALTAAHQDHGIALHGPLKSATSAQSRGAATFGQEAFTIDWDRQQAGCPGGHTSSYWRQARSQHGAPVIRIQFSPRDCKPCPRQPECINSKPGSRRDVRRELTLRPRAAHETLQQARALQQTDEWKDRYKIRAGVEGTISQGVIAHGLRRSRYRGLAKASLQHQLTAAAINIARIDAHLTGKPHAPTRISPLAALRPTG